MFVRRSVHAEKQGAGVRRLRALGVSGGLAQRDGRTAQGDRGLLSEELRLALTVEDSDLKIERPADMSEEEFFKHMYRKTGGLACVLIRIQDPLYLVQQAWMRQCSPPVVRCIPATCMLCT